MTERPHLQQEKAQLRVLLQNKLAKLSMPDQEEASVQVCSRLRQHRFWQTATSVLFYASMNGEVGTRDLVEEALAQGKLVAFPKYDRLLGIYAARQVADLEADLQRGYFGILEPIDRCELAPLNQLDLVLVPGLGFDEAGHRLGRGKGHYDRLLAAVCGIKCGLAFDCQVTAEIPAEPHDVKLDCVVTPSRWLGVA